MADYIKNKTVSGIQVMAEKPIDTIMKLLEARSNCDVPGALACYVPNATLVLHPGKQTSNRVEIQSFIAATSALPITFVDHEIVQGDGVALHISTWSINSPESQNGADTTSGRTSDVLIQQPDGRWLIAIDNPWALPI